MSSHLPYVIPGEIVPGPLYHIPRAGYTRRPLINDPITAEPAIVPSVFQEKAQNRLQDNNLIKVIQSALQKQTASQGQSQTTDKVAQPSDLSWRAG